MNGRCDSVLNFYNKTFFKFRLYFRQFFLYFGQRWTGVNYIPVKLAAQEFFPGVIERIGIYFPLLAVNSLIVFQTEARFFRMKRTDMAVSLIFCIIGFDAVMLITGVLRELFAYGTINNRIVDMNTVISGLSHPFGGFIFLGLMCGVYRFIRGLISKNNEVRSNADVSDR